MSKRKQGLGLLGLLAVTALGVMAFASSAMAVVTPQFAINGAPALHALATGTQEGNGTLSIPGLNTEINCATGEVTGGLVAGPTDAKAAKILYKSCTALAITTKAELPCHVSDVHAAAPTQLHITALNPLLLPVEFASGDYGVLAEKISVFINFLSGTGCALPLKTEVKGEVCFLLSTNDVVEPLIITNETIQKSCPKRIALEGLEPNPVGGTFEDKLLYGAQAAFITGAATLKLTGEHEGLTLGVLLL